MSADVTCAFDLAHYRELLEAAKAGGYRFAFFDREPEAGDLLLRHDVDLSLEAAIRLAELEAELGVRATYLLLKRSEFYNLAAPSGEAAIARLRELGHRVGLHAVWPEADWDERFDRVAARWWGPAVAARRPGASAPPGAEGARGAPGRVNRSVRDGGRAALLPATVAVSRDAPASVSGN